MSRHRRRLPHDYLAGEALFLTWHLHGSLPASRFPPPGRLSSGKAFVWVARYLDTTPTGSLYLKNEKIARLVVDSIHFGADSLGHYELRSYVVMANHVHLLMVPSVAPSKLMQSLKGFTAREANKILSRTGQPFWQRESYDHWVRDRKEAARVEAYIENNPVKAGLAARPQDYPWSSAAWRAGDVA